MIKYISFTDHKDCYEYHGNTMIEMTRTQAGDTISRDWIMFDSVDEATEFFNDSCYAGEMS